MAAEETVKKEPKKTSKTTAKKAAPKKKQEFLAKNYRIALIVIVVLGLAYYFRGLFVAALVNGQPITRLSVIRDVETRYGNSVLEEKVSKALLEQEMTSQGVTIGSDEIDAEVEDIKADIESSGQTLEEVLALQGMTMQELRDQLRLRLGIDKLFGSDVAISDADIDNYLTENADFLPEDMSEEELKDLAKEQLTSEKVSVAFQTWLQEAHQNAKIDYFVPYGQSTSALSN